MSRPAHDRANDELGVPSKKFIGVFWDDEKDFWQVRVKTDQGWADCGHSYDEEEAARLHDECVVELVPGNPKLNFPDA